MRILVDADACPVKGIIEKTAQKYGLEVRMYVDSSHILHSDYSKIITVGQGKDSVDIALINDIECGDIAVTQDYGVAALALSRNAFAIGNSGFIYDKDNIDRLMFERFLGQKMRNSGKNRGARIKKRSTEDDMSFERNLLRLINRLYNEMQTRLETTQDTRDKEY